MNWAEVAIAAVPVVGVIILVLLVRRPVRQLIEAANEFELNREGFKIKAQRQVAELSREAATAFPDAAPTEVVAGKARVVSVASRDQRDRLPIPELSKYLEYIASLDTRVAVLEAFERVQAGVAARFNRRDVPPPGTAESVELMQHVLDSHQYRVYELMYPVYVTARRNEGFSLSRDTALQFCKTAVLLVYLIEGVPGIRALGIKVAPHEHLGLFDDADIGEDTQHRWDHMVLDTVSQLFSSKRKSRA